jgi:hypothetical protein
MQRPFFLCDTGLLGAEAAERLDGDGCLLLRGAIPKPWIEPLREAFESGERASEDWPAPRGHDWRHALVDLDPVVQETCRLPILLAAVCRLLRRPFLLVQAEGREPLLGGGAQPLHRDAFDVNATEVVSALAFLDPFGPENGATQVAPGTHKGAGLSHTQEDRPPTITLTGGAGDVFVFDANVLHGGTKNVGGASRRSLLITFVVEELRPQFDATREIRAVRMDTSERFGPPA